IGEGSIRKATPEEVAEHLASYLPAEYKGEALESVMFNKDDGCVYGKYASKKVKKSIIAQNATTNKTEPVDGTQKTKENEVPRKDSKAKPEIDVDRKDVKNPDEVRTKEYQRGKGGEDLHSDKVPRSKNNSGLQGKEKTTFEKENADKATSGNPDTYVQDFQDSEKPAPAGKENNHTAGSEIEIRPEAQIYENLKLSKKEKDDSDDGDNAEKAEKSEEKSEKKRKLPWEKDEKDKEERDAATNTETKVAKFEKEYKEAKAALKEKEAAISRYKLRESRRKAATRYALALLNLNPTKYATDNAFHELVENTVDKMDVNAIEAAVNQMETIQKEAQSLRSKKGDIDHADEGLATAIVMPPAEQEEEAGIDLKSVLMSGTKFGRMMDDFDAYTPHQKL
ncbi:MAG: hypothetical protein ACOCUR_02615, partial [Nanoarchaeota archaeon]